MSANDLGEDLSATPRTRAGRERLALTGLVVGIGLLVFALMAVGSPGGLDPQLDQIQVGTLVGATSGPADRYGSKEVRVVGWYAELTADCSGDSGGADPSVNWLQRDCPLRVLVATQPAPNVTQRELELTGLRLAAPNGQPFPSRAAPQGPNLRGEQLVFVGHFDDAAAARCAPDRRTRCRNTFVVSTYTELVR